MISNYSGGMTNKTVPNFKFAIREDVKDSPISPLPERGTDRSTGWDVKAFPKDRQPIVVKPGEYIKISLGFRTLSPEGWWLELRPRSSSFAKKSLHFLYGVIDEDYEGDMIFAAQYLPTNKEKMVSHPGLVEDTLEHSMALNSLVIQFGEAIGQLVPVKRQEMAVTSVTNEEFDILCAERKGNRGSGGFGSTSK